MKLGSPFLRATLASVTAILLASVVASCGGSFQSGETPSSPTTGAQAAASASPASSACVNPSSRSDYTLAGARVLAGDLQVKDLTVGTGATAKVGSTVNVSYVGKLSNGTIFDNSAADNNGQPISLTLQAGKVITGWVEGLPGMRVGGSRELVIPPALGYGCTSPSAKIPANSTLIFTINLVSVS
ncbi:MAG: FKBP-type peptidyl-prolyl cis-trans isomerase [Candidatus Dormibacteria bacterium]